VSLDAEESRLLGASDFAALLGLSEWSGPVALWARMVHGWQGEGSEAMDAGNAAEDYNRALYRNRTGYALLGPAKWRHPLYPWLRCSPDDRAVAQEGRRLVELKRYNSPHGWGPEGSDAVPPHIWLQVQVQQGVGLDNGEVEESAADVSALLRGELRLYSIQHVPEVYERCLAAGERFVRDFVQPARFPEGERLVLLERDGEALRALFPAPKPDAPPMQWDALTDAQRATVREWLAAKEALSGWKKRADGLDLQVRALLREAPGLTLPDDLGRRVDFKAQAGQRRLDFDALAERLPFEEPEVRRRMQELLKQFTTKDSTRPLVAR
jgi:hypothetical protein